MKPTGEKNSVVERSEGIHGDGADDKKIKKDKIQDVSSCLDLYPVDHQIFDGPQKASRDLFQSFRRSLAMTTFPVASLLFMTTRSPQGPWAFGGLVPPKVLKVTAVLTGTFYCLNCCTVSHLFHFRTLRISFRAHPRLAPSHPSDLLSQRASNQRSTACGWSNTKVGDLEGWSPSVVRNSLSPDKTLQLYSTFWFNSRCSLWHAHALSFCSQNIIFRSWRPISPPEHPPLNRAALHHWKAATCPYSCPGGT